jgi:hypothetical protein
MCFCLLPLSASRIHEWLGRTGRRGTAWAGAALVLAWLVGLGFSLRFDVPWHSLAHAVAIDESSFRIRLLPGPESDWIDAVRQRTPVESMLLVEESHLPISILAQRSSYLAVDGRDAGRAGYSMVVKILLEQNGYPPDEIARRMRVLEASFEPTDQTDFARITAELRRLQRPVSILFGQDDRPTSLASCPGCRREIFRIAKGGWLIDDRAGRRPGWLISAQTL